MLAEVDPELPLFVPEVPLFVGVVAVVLPGLVVVFGGLGGCPLPISTILVANLMHVLLLKQRYSP